MYHELWNGTNLQKFDALNTAKYPRQTNSQCLVSQEKVIMYQSISAVLIPPSWAFANVSMNRHKTFEILSLPRGQAFVYPRNNPGAFDTLMVLVAHDKELKHGGGGQMGTAGIDWCITI